jgi:hypothetical protein
VNVVRIMVKHASEQARPLREFNPQVPDGLQQIVGHLMAKDKNQRYPTPERAAQALQTFLAAAGDPARRLEEQQGMREYLNWLDSQPAGAEQSPAPAPVSAVRRGPSPAAQAGAAWPPAAASYPAPVGISESAADVELVPQGGGAGQILPPPPRPASPGRKDMLMLGMIVGIGLAIFAVGAAFLLHTILRR